MGEKRRIPGEDVIHERRLKREEKNKLVCVRREMTCIIF